MTLNKRMKTRDTARQTVGKNMNRALHLTEDIDKSTTAQYDFAETFALRGNQWKGLIKLKP